MSLILLLPFLFLRIQAKYVNNTVCDGLQTNFNIKSVFGTWYVASVMPKLEANIDWANNVSCYKVEFIDVEKDHLSDIEMQSLKYALSMNMVENEGMLIRQKFSSERPVELIWSNDVEINGCFRQVMGSDMEGGALTQGIVQSPSMQLHLVDGDLKREITGPILLQILWEETVNAVIYRRQMEYDSDDLIDTVLDAMGDLRKGLVFPYPSYCEELFKNYKQT